jgi:integrase
MARTVLELLRSRTRHGDRELVFGKRGGPYSRWTEAKTSLDMRIGLLSPWVVHDLRRTVATGMADIGIQPHIIEAVLNHVSGHKGGVAGIYNRANYANEKAEALARWDGHVATIVGGRQ